MRQFSPKNTICQGRPNRVSLHKSSILQPMLMLTKISLTQFKNYPLQHFDFRERVIGICGMNGKGKTNLLDAIYYCCFSKSYFSRSDAQQVQFGADGFRLSCIFNLQQDTIQQTHSITCILRGTGKKELLCDDVPYTKFSEHIGRFPSVMIAPDDIELVTGSGEIRRRYLDTVLSQTDPVYLRNLIIHNKLLQQRNSLLKRFAEQGQRDFALLDVIDLQLIEPALFIHKSRQHAAERLIGNIRHFYQLISGNAETIDLKYVSQLNDSDYSVLLKNNRDKDCITQRSNYGIHKDDILFSLNGNVFRDTASQGQRKSLLFALKLAEFCLLRDTKGFSPLLLLDDVFEKLDEIRMHQLLNWVCRENDGQVFITDTHCLRLKESLDQTGTTYQLIGLPAQ